MNILITNVRLSMLTGTETFTRDLALGLRAAGHSPYVYTPKPGIVSDDLLRQGVPVVTSLGALAVRPDVIHSNQHAELVASIVHFPDVPAIFTCHGPIDWCDHPPCLQRIAHFVAVDETRRQRLLRERWITPDDITIIGNSVDLDRFVPRASALPHAPRRALLVSNNATTTNFGADLINACDAVGLPIEVVGSGVGRVERDLPGRLSDVDLVFGVGRSVMEAMATGAACILCDLDGLGPLVTSANVRSLRQYNFGRALAREPITASGLAARLAQYNPEDAAAVQRDMREHASLEAMVSQYERVYQLAMARRRELPELSEDMRQYCVGLLRSILALLNRD
jgi:glycosyltransferase involved in cell wall biosynthesis